MPVTSTARFQAPPRAKSQASARMSPRRGQSFRFRVAEPTDQTTRDTAALNHPRYTRSSTQSVRVIERRPRHFPPYALDDPCSIITGTAPTAA
jgi:hypothetical protein